ncbi:MAG: acetylxylan esterase [Victivallaceae bacterium]|nr:acetylxylan esterase [Victivallaceae bacterium]
MADYLNRYPHMVHEYYTARVRNIITERKARLAALKTKADAEAYVARVRKAVAGAFVLPERTPLNVKSTGVVEQENFSIEKIVFESRPGFQVTGNLYIPKSSTSGAKAPAVLGLCGHDLEGKAAEPYQSFCQGLALKGFIVFIIDPISQGERWQHDEAANDPGPGLCDAHNLMGNQQILLNDFFGSWRVWDAIRGLDYLLSRPEVDSTRLGVTGNSGGGTLTSLVAALDPRPTMVAPSCYICSWQANMENELPADAEQCPPGLLAAGLDEVDLLIAYPRPTMILSQEHDFFDERYARQAHQELKKIHQLLGTTEDAAYFMGPMTHGYHQENREAMTAFFMQHAGISGSAEETAIELLPAEQLWVTVDGNVNKNGSCRVFDFSCQRAAELATLRSSLNYNELTNSAAELLNIPLERVASHYSCLRNLFTIERWDEQKAYTQFTVETEPGIKVLLTSYGVEHSFVRLPKGKVRLYVGNVSGEQDIAEIPEIKALVRDDIALIVADPRGIGQSEACSCNMKDFFSQYGSDYLYAVTADMFDENYLGQRVFDILHVMDLLIEQGATEIELIGRGVGAVTAAFAGLLHESKPEVKLINYLPSYQLLVESQRYLWPLSVMPRGILEKFDLPDIYTALGTRLETQSPWNELMQ